MRWRTASGGSKLMVLTLSRAKYRSPSFGARIWPSTVSPVRRREAAHLGRADIDVVRTGQDSWLSGCAGSRSRRAGFPACLRRGSPGRSRPGSSGSRTSCPACAGTMRSRSEAIRRRHSRSAGDFALSSARCIVDALAWCEGRAAGGEREDGSGGRTAGRRETPRGPDPFHPGRATGGQGPQVGRVRRKLSQTVRFRQSGQMATLVGQCQGTGHRSGDPHAPTPGRTSARAHDHHDHDHDHQQGGNFVDDPIESRAVPVPVMQEIPPPDATGCRAAPTSG